MTSMAVATEAVFLSYDTAIK